MDIRTDPLVNEIRDLAPEVRIAGGTMGSVILLSVKEAVYKALNPVLGIRWGTRKYGSRGRISRHKG